MMPVSVVAVQRNMVLQFNFVIQLFGLRIIYEPLNVYHKNFGKGQYLLGLDYLACFLTFIAFEIINVLLSKVFVDDILERHLAF